MIVHEDYLVDEGGRRKAAVVPIDEWEHVLEALEQLDEIKAYDKARSYPSEPIPFDQAVQEIREDPGE